MYRFSKGRTQRKAFRALEHDRSFPGTWRAWFRDIPKSSPGSSFRYNAIRCRNAEHEHRRLTRHQNDWYKTVGGVGNVGRVESTSRSEDSSARTDSTASLGSDRSETGTKRFSELLAELNRAERSRKRLHRRHRQMKEALKGFLFRVDNMHANLRHLERRRRMTRRQGEDMENLQCLAVAEKRLDLLVTQQHKTLEQLFNLECQLRHISDFQNKNEPKLFRAAQGFISNVRLADPDEKLATRDFNRDVRHIADFGRYQIARRREQAVDSTCSMTPEALVERSNGQLVVGARQAARVHEQQYRERMTEFYKATEPVMINADLLEPESSDGEESGSSDDKEPDRPDVEEPYDESHLDKSATDSKLVDLLDALEAAREERNAAHKWLCTDLRNQYVDDRRTYIMTYQDDGEATFEEEEQRRTDRFDREYLRRGKDANDRMREADAKWLALRNQAIEDKIYDEEEADLFGILDHPDNGFTESLASSSRDRCQLRIAGVKPGVEKWLRGAGGSAHCRPAKPDDSPDIPSGRSVRRGGSFLYNVFVHEELVQRWEAEMVVTRAEADLKRQEFYASQASK